MSIAIIVGKSLLLSTIKCNNFRQSPNYQIIKFRRVHINLKFYDIRLYSNWDFLLSIIIFRMGGKEVDRRLMP